MSTNPKTRRTDLENLDSLAAGLHSPTWSASGRCGRYAEDVDNAVAELTALRKLVVFMRKRAKGEITANQALDIIDEYLNNFSGRDDDGES